MVQDWKSAGSMLMVASQTHPSLFLGTALAFAFAAGMEPRHSRLMGCNLDFHIVIIPT
jgi:hypothetical protein